MKTYSRALALEPGSALAYDFKLEGVAQDFGRSTAAPQPFRLAGGRDAVAAYHRALGWQLERLESSAFDLDALPGGDTPLVVVPAAP